MLNMEKESSSGRSSNLQGIPKLEISRELAPSECYDPTRTFFFRYRAKDHTDLPHVVKFSGGRSSGLLLFTLVENGFLRQERGDVVIFNNTSCEHPETYKFVAECKRRIEEYGIPFFMIQFQTFEDARQGEWKRIPSYKMVNEKPFSPENPEGFQWKGEVFEETLSNKSYLPNQFSRVCTQSLKLETTRQFLRDWFASKKNISHQGHGVEESQVNLDQMYRQHRRNGGSVPRDILLAKKEFVLNRPTHRPKQYFEDFSSTAKEFKNDAVSSKVFGKKAWFGKEGIQYVAFIGLRADEQLRVTRVETRAANPHANVGYEGEHVYMPLATMHISRDDVSNFWKQQDWDLNLPDDGTLSNCVYCFLKGVKSLAKVHNLMEKEHPEGTLPFGPTTGTPCDIKWWIDKESRYGRDLVGENRERSNPDAQDFIGFFGASTGFSYEILAEKAEDSQTIEAFSNVVLPCDCTE